MDRIFYREYSPTEGYKSFDPELNLSPKGKDKFDKLMGAIEKFGLYPLLLFEKTYKANKTYRISIILFKKELTDKIKTLEEYIHKNIYSGNWSSTSFVRLYVSPTTDSCFGECLFFRVKRNKKSLSFRDLYNKLFKLMKGKYLKYGYYEESCTSAFPADELELEMLSLI